ncbi:hypothetical protein [Acaryochloris marina]|uniref:Uncharacterized protein n=2 Tax=Acaryochloris marina TaxID=155978 RepID=A8ZPZ9_ACAM1|nr:hypothetical protein [Acaryochloris marina]ABW33166.1 hypothetical protein AM1_F0016 [Acaryochloris marina MBIC11017]
MQPPGIPHQGAFFMMPRGNPIKMYVAKIEVWNGRSFQLIDFQQAQTQESLRLVIRECVAAMGLKLIYWYES